MELVYIVGKLNKICFFLRVICPGGLMVLEKERRPSEKLAGPLLLQITDCESS